MSRAGAQAPPRNVALDPRLMHADGLHPNARGEPVVLDNVWPYLKPMLVRSR